MYNGQLLQLLRALPSRSIVRFVLVFMLVIFILKCHCKSCHTYFVYFPFVCSDNADDTFRRLSTLSPFQVAELCEQANSVAVQFRRAAEELRTSQQSSAVAADAEDATETSAEIKCPMFTQTDDVDSLRDSRSAGAVLASKAKANKPFAVNSSQSQTRSKEVPLVRRNLASALKENKAPATAVLPSAGRKAVTGASKACD